jgi:hypothetical protein
LIVIRQQAHPAQEEVQYEAEVLAPVHSRKAIWATASGFSHNVERRTMPHAFWGTRFRKQFDGDLHQVVLSFRGIVRPLKVSQKWQHLIVLIDFGPGSRQLFTATVNQKVTYGLPTTRPEPASWPLAGLDECFGLWVLENSVPISWFSWDPYGNSECFTA